MGRAAGTLLTLAFVAFSAVVFYHSDFNPLRTDRRYNWKLAPKITASDDDRADIAREAPPPVYRPKTDRRRGAASTALYVEDPEPLRRELTIEELIRLNNQASSRNRRRGSAPRVRRTSTLDSDSLPKQTRPATDGEGFY